MYFSFNLVLNLQLESTVSSMFLAFNSQWGMYIDKWHWILTIKDVFMHIYFLVSSMYLFVSSYILSNLLIIVLYM